MPAILFFQPEISNFEFKISNFKIEVGSSVFIRTYHRLQEAKVLELMWTQKLQPESLESGITIQLKEKV